MVGPHRLVLPPVVFFLSLEFGVEVQCFAGGPESDPELGDWTWAPRWLLALCVLRQRAEAAGEADS